VNSGKNVRNDNNNEVIDDGHDDQISPINAEGRPVRNRGRPVRFRDYVMDWAAGSDTLI
jgi:hypothetical protein